MYMLIQQHASTTYNDMFGKVRLDVCVKALEHNAMVTAVDA